MFYFSCKCLISSFACSFHIFIVSFLKSTVNIRWNVVIRYIKNISRANRYTLFVCFCFRILYRNFFNFSAILWYLFHTHQQLSVCTFQQFDIFIRIVMNNCNHSICRNITTVFLFIFILFRCKTSLVQVIKQDIPCFITWIWEWLCQTVSNDYNGRTSQQGHLYVAHHRCSAVNILVPLVSIYKAANSAKST